MQKNKLYILLLCICFNSFLFVSCRHIPQDYAPEKPMYLNTVSLDTIKVLVLGNSLVWHPPAKSVHWEGNWGMAASAKNKDLVHQLDKLLNTKFNKPVKVTFDNVNFNHNLVKLEHIDKNYNFSRLEKHLVTKPDIVIMRVGDNVKPATRKNRKIWKTKYNKFIHCLNRHKPVLISTGSWYPNHKVSKIIRDAAVKTNTVYINLHHIFKDKSNHASHERDFKTEAVGSHPGDKGMKAIAVLLFKTINKYCK